MKLEVVQMVGDVVAASAHWVASRAVRAQDIGVTVEACKIVAGTSPAALIRAIKNVVGLVGSVTDVAEDRDGGDYRVGSAWRDTGVTCRAFYLLACPA